MTYKSIPTVLVPRDTDLSHICGKYNPCDKATLYFTVMFKQILSFGIFFNTSMNLSSIHLDLKNIAL